MPRFTAVSLRRLALLPTSLALAVTSIGAGAAPAEPATVATGARTAAPAVPNLNWGRCNDLEEEFQCARATVPLDYARPAGETITIALARLPASDPARRIGSLFINPGGPGGSGIDSVPAAYGDYSDDVRARFDIVGFDPRFVGESRPVATCASDDEYTELMETLPAFPVTRAEERRVYQAHAQYNAWCAERSPFLAYGATANVARDLDLLRQAVGDAKLNYVGYSYGSVLGQTYAALFPNRIRSLTIDGVLDNKAWSTGSPGESRRVPFTTRIDSAPGAYRAFTRFTALCDKAGTQACAFAAGGKARAKYDRLAARLRRGPVEIPGLGAVGYADLVTRTVQGLYAPLAWQYVAQDLQDIYAAVFGSRTTARTRTDDSRPGGTLADRSAGAPRWQAGGFAPPLTRDFGQAVLSTVACNDTINPRSLRRWSTAAAAADREAPYFGRAWTWVGISCSTWQLPAKGRYLGPYNRPTSAPLLVIGNTFDPSTPYTGAQAAARRIPGARLLTVDGYGHTTLAAPSACAAATFDAYLIAGKLPPRGKVCRQDIAPFTPF